MPIFWSLFHCSCRDKQKKMPFNGCVRATIEVGPASGSLCNLERGRLVKRSTLLRSTSTVHGLFSFLFCFCSRSWQPAGERHQVDRGGSVQSGVPDPRPRGQMDQRWVILAVRRTCWGEGETSASSVFPPVRTSHRKGGGCRRPSWRRRRYCSWIIQPFEWRAGNGLHFPSSSTATPHLCFSRLTWNEWGLDEPRVCSLASRAAACWRLPLVGDWSFPVPLRAGDSPEEGGGIFFPKYFLPNMGVRCPCGLTSPICGLQWWEDYFAKTGYNYELPHWKCNSVTN